MQTLVFHPPKFHPSDFFFLATRVVSLTVGRGSLMDGLDVVCPQAHTLHSQRLSDMGGREMPPPRHTSPTTQVNLAFGHGCTLVVQVPKDTI